MQSTKLLAVACCWAITRTWLPTVPTRIKLTFWLQCVLRTSKPARIPETFQSSCNTWLVTWLFSFCANPVPLHLLLSFKLKQAANLAFTFSSCETQIYVTWTGILYTVQRKELLINTLIWPDSCRLSLHLYFVSETGNHFCLKSTFTLTMPQLGMQDNSSCMPWGTLVLLNSRKHSQGALRSWAPFLHCTACYMSAILF